MSMLCSENVRALASSPSPTTSCCVSGDEHSEDTLPSNLADEELQLALHKEATEEELTKAISRCKDLVLESDHCSPERKWLVRHLIELRLRLQECREAMTDPQHPRNKSSGVSRRTIRGHHLQLQPLLRSTNFRYCDHCTGTIWSVVQAWYQCEDCGYVCHYKCMLSILRECAHVTASEKGGYELDICPEEGLSAQKYRCAECNAQIPINTEFNDGRRCDYTGKYYCSACHWNSTAIIPARLIHNWDLSQYPVCQASLQLLRITANRPLINLEKLNPKLFPLVHELNLVKRLRYELHNLNNYLLACRSAKEDHLLWKTVENTYLVELPDLYSLQDLIDTNSGELPSKLQTLVETFHVHIKETCEICKGHGHICEVCKNVQVLFPFDNTAHVCDKCNAVTHKKCFERKKHCLKCERLKMRREEEEKRKTVIDEGSDADD